MDIANRVVVLTGAKRLGHAVALGLAAAGADIALVFRDSRHEAEATTAGVEALHRRSLLVRADLGEPADCQRAMNDVAAAFGRLDILVNMASSYRAVAFDAITVESWNEDLSINLRSAYLCALAAVPHMRQSGGGRIINISDWRSASGRPQYPGLLSYYVAKRGVIALTEALALELAADQILVNGIAPGPVAAPPGLPDDQTGAVARPTPLGHGGGGDEILEAVQFLIASDFVTGETIRVDGGSHLR